MAWCTTRTPDTLAAWTACGGCTSGWTARRRAATRPASGGVTATRTARLARASKMTDGGGGAMSAMWMPAGGPGQTWGGAAASFVAMWVPMMAAMKLPSLVTTLLRRLRNSGKQNSEHNDRLEDDRHARVRPRQ